MLLDTPSISTTIRVLTISVESVVTNLPELSVCHSLGVLNLSYIATETTNFDIPSLKKLILCDCRFECGMGDSLDLFEECVNLRYLYFHSCVYYGDVKSFIISAPQLIRVGYISDIDLNFVEKIDMNVRWETSYTRHGVYEEDEEDT
ncbi:hypothetical protein ACSQ67_017694 [Phaseolus vulgaris]